MEPLTMQHPPGTQQQTFNLRNVHVYYLKLLSHHLLHCLHNMHSVSCQDNRLLKQVTYNNHEIPEEYILLINQH